MPNRVLLRAGAFFCLLPAFGGELCAQNTQLSIVINLNGQQLQLAGAATLQGESETAYITGVSGGSISATTLNVNHPNQLNVGQLGAALTSSANLGNLTVSRMGKPANDPGHSGIQGINRTYVIQPQNNSGLNATLRFYYLAEELNGKDPSTLVLWKSTDGVSWSFIGADTRNAAQKYVEKTGINDFSLWTLTLFSLTNPGSGTVLALTAGGTGNGATIANTNAANTANGINVTTNSNGNVGNHALGNAGNFVNTNTISVGAGVRGEVSTLSTTRGAAGVYGVASGIGGYAGYFDNTSTSNSNTAVYVINHGTGTGLMVDQTGSSGDIAIFQTNEANVARVSRSGRGFFNGGTQSSGADVAEDLLVTSSRAGYSMRADLNKLKPGQAIGKALQDFVGDSGKINVLVNVK
jgi:hypothetical protein